MNRLTRLIFAALAVCACSAAALAQTISLAQSPLLTSNSSAVKPNLLFVLDDSGSMNWDYVPDWVPNSYCKSTGTGFTSCCSGSGGSDQCMGLASTNTPVGTRGLPPYTNSDFNGVYYNPTITYAPPIKADGSPWTSYSSWTAVPADAFQVDASFNPNGSKIELPKYYPDIEYCTSTDYTTCLRSDNYLLPGTIFGTTYATAHRTDVSHANNVTSSTADFVGGSLASPTITNRAIGPYYYVMIPGEYCTNKKLTNCVASKVPTAVNPYPARLRWCSNTARTTCQATKTTTYQYARYPTMVLASYAYASGSATAGVAQNASFTISSIKAGATELLAAPIVCSNASVTCNTGSATTTVRNAAVAAAIQNAINANSATGFGADANAAVVKISAPAGTTYNGATLKFNNAGSMSGFTLVNFNSSGTSSGSSVPGAFKRVDIVSGQTYGSLWIDAAGMLYTSSGAGRSLVLDRSTRTDCVAAPNCTYAEEMTNFANWYAYYRTRIQMMKSALSRAFAGLPNGKYRVGFFTINSGAFGAASITKSITGSTPNRYSTNDFLDIAPWDDAQREYWYNTLFKTAPGGMTPLRLALSRAGMMYAHMLKGASDPIEESCQQNFTILSSDGYWNEDSGVRITGGTPANPTTAVMNDQDGTSAMAAWATAFPWMTDPSNEPKWPRPYLDAKNNADTLADVAAFYYFTDLRKSAWGNCTSGVSGHDVCTDDVLGKNADPKSQHMATFTIGLINGVMQYRDNYQYAPSAGDTPDDYVAVLTGTGAGSGVCSWQASGSCTWPTPSSGSPENIDDLWHAAVNGHGSYYLARNPAELYNGLASALATVNIQLGSGAAATTSSPNISQNNNFALSTTYTTGDWTGDVFMQTIDVNTGLLSSSKVWSAQPGLDGVNAATRNIWMLTTDTANYPSRVKPFQWANLAATDLAKPCGDTANERACFSSPYIDSLSQYCNAGVGCLDAAAKANASGANLVSYLRGDATQYYSSSNGTVTGYYRARKHILGDIVNSEAVYVQGSPFSWDESTNPGYTSFAQSNYGRAGSVYVAANDGMLHALNSLDGAERWAYVPSMVLPWLYRLADTNYSHQYFVDSTPVIGDAAVGGAWRTMLVGGLGAGGVGYYALDVTNPAAPTGLWEFKKRTTSCAASPASAVGLSDDCDIGNSLGNPVITKYCTAWTDATFVNADGSTSDVPLSGTCTAYTWAVLVTSGYNNVSASPLSGKGLLYVLDASTGKILKKFSTGVGSTDTPSNLGRLNVWANNGMQDNVATTAYAGDMQGNLWRFNLYNGTVSKLASLGADKPITAKPSVGLIGGGSRVIFVPTGRLLSNSAPYDDLNLAATQGFYAVLDSNNGTTKIPPSNFAVAPISCSSGGGLGDCTATSQPNVFSDGKDGWYFDFPGAGERGYTDPDIVFGTIVFSSGSPTGSGCSPSGSGRIWALDAASGGLVPGATKAAAMVAYMPPRPVPVSIGGRIEVIGGHAGGTGANAFGGGSGLVFGIPAGNFGAACSGTCPKVSRHTVWRILPD